MLGGRSGRFLWWALLLAGAPCGRLWPATFIPGDANSSGAVNVTDAVAIFRQLFLGDTALVACRAAADVDGNATVDLTDGVRLLGFLFLGGPPPVSQGVQLPGCAVQSPDDSLGCELPGRCGTRGVFLVLAKDGGMVGTKFKWLQDEVLRRILSLEDDDEFGIIFYDAGMSKFPNSNLPAAATAPLKAAGVAFIQSTAPGHGSCPKPALLAALEYARQSGAAEKSIIYISDGINLCPGHVATQYSKETLALVKERNTEKVRIDTIGPPGSVDENFLRMLAAQNGGTFSRIVN